jgi:dTDP-4-dehydrorhamnose 3,5-epimerase
LLIEKSQISDVLLITPRRFGDRREFLAETYSHRSYAQHDIDMNFVQDNHSISAEVGTVRGLHFQAPPYAQDKLVRCGSGKIFDVAVDIRKGSPTYRKWVGVELSFENGKQLIIPAGFLHGFITREPDTEIIYKCTDYYAAECDGAVRFDDPEIGIDWGLGDMAPLLSDKDAKAPLLKEFISPFSYGN